jgi:hypothetical protein
VDNDAQRGKATSCAEALTPELPETDESSFVAELVRQAISKRAADSRYPLGWMDPQRIDRVLGEFTRQRK